jgi:hypothetical protein
LRNLFGLFLLFSLLYLAAGGCGSKQELQHQPKGEGEFNWKDNLGISDVPDFPVKGYLNGQEVRLSYVVFEKWRGSNDNVLNFSVTKPEQPCGFIENYSGFQFLNKGGVISQGEWVKPKFESELGSHDAYYKYTSADGNSFRSVAAWNCALKIESITDKSVTGKIALCFDDDKKSWIAGRFEAAVCNN